MDSDLRLGQIAVRMGVIPPHALPALLREARAGHTEESAGGATALGQVLLRRKLCSISDYLYMARQAREEAAAEEAQGAPTILELESALDRLESGDLDPAEFERLLVSSGDPLPRERAAPARFGSYELLAEVARGGMGIVYRARDVRDGQVVALKVMIEADDDEVRLQRFEREAELAAALDHPNIVRIHEAGREDGMPFFTMDLVEGDSLDNLLDRGELSREEVLRALAQVARGVDHAHSRGIVHRDLKPGNILIDRRTKQARITDFGLARDLARVTRLTQVGQAVGTPYYMAPEQVRGERDVDGRCDIYAIGVILYEALTGDVPFDADSPMSLFKKIDREPVVLEVDPARGIDERIHRIAMRALAKDREERYATGELLARDLERYLEGREPRALPHPPAFWLADRLGGSRAALAVTALGVVALVVLVAAGALGWRRLQDRRAREAGRAQAEQRAHEAGQARDEALRALEAGRADEAMAHAERGLAHLDEVAPLLAGGGPAAEGAGEAWSRLQAPAIQGELVAALGRALAALADERPELRARAREALAGAVDARPRDVELRLLLARVLEEGGDPAAAVAELERALEVDPARVDALVRRGRLCLQLGRAMDASLSLSDALRHRPREVDALVLRAEAYIALGRLDAARTDAREAAAIDAARPEPHLALGQVAAARGQADEAASHFRAAARLAPDDPGAPLRLGDLLLDQGAYEDAREEYVRALDLGAGPEAAVGQGVALAFLGDAAAARLAIEAGLAAVDALPAPARARARARALGWLGAVALVEGDLAGARDAFSRALDVAPTGTPERLAAAVRLARLHLDAPTPDPAAARALLERIPEERLRADADALEAAARAALDAGRPMDARDLAERALAASGRARHPRARRTLALARQAIALDEPARGACAAAWEDSTWGGDLASEHVRRAIELVALAEPAGIGRATLLEPAARLLEGSLRLDPRQARAWAALARVRAARGDAQGEWDALARARDLDRFQPDLAVALARAALASGDAARVAAAADALEVVGRFEGRTAERLVLLARCRARLGQVEPALVAADLAVRTAPDDPTTHEVQALVLQQAGRADDADAAAQRAAERRARLEALLERAGAAPPEEALRAAREAMALGAAEAGLRAGALEDDPAAALEALARAARERGADVLDALDQVLAERWRSPLPEDRRRLLLLQARDAPVDAHLAVALAALADGLVGELDPSWAAQALGHAIQAVGDAPGSLAAHAARAFLRARTGDAARACRELEALTHAAPDSPLPRFLLAEALAARGQTAAAREALARCRGRLPRFDERVAASPFLR